MNKVISRLGSHKVEGEIYPNLPSICKEYNLSLNTIYKRWSRGKRGDDLVPLKKRKSYIEPIIEPKYKLEVNGIKFKSFAKACSHFNVEFITFRVRRKRGLTIRQSLGIDAVEDRRRTSRKIKRKKNKPVNLFVNGEYFKTYSSLAAKYNMPCHILYNRMHLGYTAEEAINLKGKGVKVNYNGKDYKSYSALARQYKITPEDFRAALKRGKTIGQIIGSEPYTTKHTVKYMGKVYKNMKALADNFNITPGALYHRLRIGLSLDQSIKVGETVINKGRYNETILNRSPELANKNASLYFIKLKIEGLSRYKIGITESLKNRFKKIKYYHVIKTFNSNLINCYKLEREILEEFAKKKDKTVNASHLDGYSEILANLTENDIDRIILLINRYKS